MIIQRQPLRPEQLPFLEDSFPADSLFFDIETTGLSHRTSHLYLIGAICRDQGQLQLIQWFLQKPSEEKEVLKQFSDLLKQYTTVIHYNGQSFDLPFLQDRCKHWDLELPFGENHSLQSLDLYRKLLPLKKGLGMNSMKQKEMELLLHFPRTDRMTGKELIDVYKQYLQTADNIRLQLLLQHNQDDLLGMLPIYHFYRYLLSIEELPPVTQVKLEKNILHLKLKTHIRCPLSVRLETSDVELRFLENEIMLSISGTSGSFKHYYNNYKDYYYLPMEDTAIHKSVGIYVDPSCRQKAKADTCYTRKDGLFFFQPSPVFLPEFRQDTRKGPSYFSSDQLDQEPELLGRYASELILFLLKV